MNEEMRKGLDETIERLLTKASSPDLTNEEYHLVMNNLSILYKMKLEDERNATEVEHKTLERRNRFILEAAGIALPMMFYWVWMSRGFKFEESGTYTSNTFRGLFNKFRPTTF